MALTSIFPAVAEVAPSEQPSAENVDVTTDGKSTDEQAPTKEAFVKPSIEAQRNNGPLA
jgi:hypothetical protein